MNRRKFLQHVAALPALPVISPLLHALAPKAPTPSVPAAPTPTVPKAPSPFRRVRPADPGWPSSEAWEKLKQRVGGRLIPVAPPLAPCVDAPGSAACNARIEELQNPYFISEQPGGTQLSGWLDAWTAAPSVYAVVAKNAADVAAAVNFARDHRLRLVVKGTGHSYLGTSNAPDSLLVWTHAMNAITLHDAFVPRGCSAAARPAVTVEPGVRWLEAYDAVTTKGGRYVQGGGCCTVGVGGLVQGGGFGSFSKSFGLAAAGLLEAEVVTADGKIVIANACTNPDLFWALKGGGGGTFGVVTRLTLATHELPEFAGGAEGKIHAKSDAAFRRLIAEFLRFYEKNLFNPHWGEQAHFGKDNVLTIQMVFIGLTDDEAEATWKPFKDFIAASPNDFTYTDTLGVGTMPARHWWDAAWSKEHGRDAFVSDPRPGAPAGNVWWKGNTGECNAFLYGYESLWMPAALLKDPGRLADALFDASRHFEVQFHFNKGLAGAPAERLAAARDTAMNPAVTEAFTLALIATGAPNSNPGVKGREPDLTEGKREAAAITAAADRLRGLAPDSGSYFNETNYFERSFQKSFWGPNYPRLAQIKKKYDPEGLFFVHNGVGSEEWSRDGFERISAF
jgi:FAD/FMN-containing dehydrogenase